MIVGTTLIGAECFELTKTSITANCTRRSQICNGLQHAGLTGYVWGISGSWYPHGFLKNSTKSSGDCAMPLHDTSMLLSRSSPPCNLIGARYRKFDRIRNSWRSQWVFARDSHADETLYRSALSIIHVPMRGVTDCVETRRARGSNIKSALHRETARCAFRKRAKIIHGRI